MNKTIILTDKEDKQILLALSIANFDENFNNAINTARQKWSENQWSENQEDIELTTFIITELKKQSYVFKIIEINTIDI